MTRKMRRDSFDDIFDQMQDFFQEMGNDLTRSNTPVDIRNEDEHVIVQADIPGVQKEDISLKADKDQLQISAETEEEYREENEKYLKKERSSRRFSRTVPWPKEVDPESIHAEYSDGVLEVTAEKEGDNGKDIEIH